MFGMLWAWVGMLWSFQYHHLLCRGFSTLFQVLSQPHMGLLADDKETEALRSPHVRSLWAVCLAIKV